MIKKLLVLYEGWGERYLLGTLADTGRDLFFEYSPEAVLRGLQLSPLHHPLPKPGSVPIASKGSSHLQGLPGFVADALPDGWGMLLMDRALRKLGRAPQEVSVLDRLAIVGSRAMGALSFEPSEESLMDAEKLLLADLAKEVVALQGEDAVASRKTDAQLQHLMRLGGSPQGARPKVMVDFNRRTGQVTSGLGLAGAATPWLVKFPGGAEHREVCALEEWYARVARHGGMDMPVSRFFDLGPKHSAFGVQRFDRQVVNAMPVKQNLRVPMMSLAAYLQADFRLPSLDYETVLLATLKLSGDLREVQKAFERCVFNVLMHNRDDHAKNFAYLMDAQGFWKLSAAFDLTFSHGPGGEHCTSVSGHGKLIERTHLLAMAQKAGLKKEFAARCLDHWVKQVRVMQKHAKGLTIRKATVQQILKTTHMLCDLCAQ